MDMIMLDITDARDVEVDDEVTLIGEQDGASITADDVAALCDTISYEVIAGIMARVPRLYVKDGELVAVQDLASYRVASAL